MLTAICTYTKFARAWPLSLTTSQIIAQTLVNEHFAIFGMAKTIHSDNGSNFCSDLMVELSKLMGFRRTTSHTYSAWNNAIIERFHLTLEQSITAQANKHPKSWDEYVPLTVLGYNAQPHSSTGFSPFKMQFGQEAILPLDLIFGPTPSDNNLCPHDYINWLEQALIETYNMANNKLQGNLKYMKQHYDEKAYGKPNEVDETVWVLKGKFEKRKVT